MRYQVCYCDVPWMYRNVKTGGSMLSGAAAKYKTISTDKLCTLDVQKVMDKNSVLFFWTTVPMFEDALRIMHAWGYQYKSLWTWRKIMSLGMGFWARIQTEHLILGIHGKVKAFRCQRPNFIQTKALRHSHKPPEFRQLIDVAVKDMGPKLELFSTEKDVPGWTTIGFEANGQDVFEYIEKFDTL